MRHPSESDSERYQLASGFNLHAIIENPVYPRISQTEHCCLESCILRWPLNAVWYT